MRGLMLSYEEFITAVQMSKLPHILLEGSQDKTFFTRMCETAAKAVPHKDVTIATAEQLRSDVSVLGNRDKVEKVCELVSTRPFQYRFVGFVDRELREFSLDEAIDDELQKHHCEGRLVWSRGHSIENYMFDFEVAKQPLLDCSTNQEIAEIALGVLERQFSQVIGIACALGLTGVEYNQLDVVRRSVNWTTLQLLDGTFCWDVDTWRRALSERSSLTESDRTELVEGFHRWSKVINESAPENVRWACDGHTGWALIWAAYARVIFDTAASETDVNPSPATQRDAVLRIHDNVRFNYLARNWAMTRARDTGDSPLFCFSMIGVLPSTE